jgi:AcrR family transcriptional regulator
VLKQDRARKTHEVLLDAAADEFVRRGYAAANLKQIADQVGMSKGALYAHFPSKEALAAALTAPFDQAWRAILRQARDSHPPLQTLQGVMAGLADRLRDDVRFRAGLQLASEEARARGDVPAVIGETTRVVTTLVHQAQQHGELQTAHPPEALGQLAVACVFGLYHVTSHHRLDHLPDEVHRIWHLTLSPAVT